MKNTLRKELVLPVSVTAKINHTVKLIGPQGEVEKKLLYPTIQLFQEGNKIILLSQKATKKEKKVLNAFYAHLKNMLQGITKKYVYRLKICSGHFPMNVSVSGNQVILKNFFGETVPRKLAIPLGAEVKVEGNEILVSSTNKETAGQMAASLERLCKIKNRDLRIFQDGIYIISKSCPEEAK